MMRSITKDKRDKILRVAAAAAFWLAVWQLVYVKVGQDLLLTSPSGAIARLIVLTREPVFLRSVTSTCLRVIAGFLLALIAGTLLAVACARFKTIYALSAPLLGIVRATPVASFIILVLLWFSSDRLPVFIAFLMVMPLVCANVLSGINEADEDLLEMAVIFHMPRGKIITAIYMPSVMPYFIPACSAGLGFAWKSAIAAEVICLPHAAIGRQIYNAKIYLESADLFAWTIAVIILSLFIEKLVIGVLKRLGSRLAEANEVKTR